MVKIWIEVNYNKGKVVIYRGIIKRVKKIIVLLDYIRYWSKAGNIEDKVR